MPVTKTIVLTYLDDDANFMQGWKINLVMYTANDQRLCVMKENETGEDRNLKSWS